MISKRDVQLGKIALKEGFISKDQLTKCLALKKKLAAEKGKKVALGALLLKKGYLDKAQLEECVKRHNAALEKAGAKGEASEERASLDEKARKKRRAARATSGKSKASASASEDASEERPASRSKERKHSAGGEGDDEAPKASTATATKDARSGDSKSKDARSRDSKSRDSKSRDSKSRDSKSRDAGAKDAEGKDRNKSKPGAKGSAPASRSQRSSRSKRSKREDDPIESAIEAVDPSVFASAIESEVETDTRRLIACPECGKKFRVKQNQVGRRFNCRRCEHRIKVPKDLFTRDSEISEVHAAVEVEEFVLGSGEFSPDEESDAPAGKRTVKGKPKPPLPAKSQKTKAGVAAAAAQAAKAVSKVGEGQLSIADLAAQAANFKAAPMAPKRKFGVKDLGTMIASAAALAGLCFGSWQFFVAMPAAEKEAKHLARLDAVYKKIYQDPLDLALESAAQALKDENPRALGSAREQLAQLAKMDGLLGDTKARASAYAAKQDLETKIRDYMVTEGRLYLKQGGLQATRGLEVLSKALELPGIPEEVRLEVARIQIEHRQFETAIKILGEASSAPAKALVGLAWERGGVSAEASKAYQGLGHALVPVLVARAHLAEGNPKAALAELQRATGLEGEDQAAALVVEGSAHEADGNLSAAGAAFDRAVAAAGESPVPVAARAEFLLRRGKLEEALADAKRSPCPRGMLVKGDVLLAQLELDKAGAAYREAASATPRVPGKLVEGIDPFAAFAPSDPGTVARCRLAQIHFAQGSYGQAQEVVNEALNLHPNEPMALATLTLFSLLQELQDAPDIYLERALTLIARAKPRKVAPYVTSRESAFVLFVRGLQRFQKDRADEALAALELAPSFDPDLTAPCNVLIGRCYEAKGRRSDAKAAYLKSAQAERNSSLELLAGKVGRVKLPGIEEAALALLTRNPYHAQARLIRAEARLAAGKAPESLADVSEAITFNPQIQAAFLQRAFLYLRDLPQALRDPDKGGHDVTAALQLEGSEGKEVLQYAQALHLWSSGDAEGSFKFLAACLEENADYAWGWDLRARQLDNAGQKDEAAAARAKFEALRKK